MGHRARRGGSAPRRADRRRTATRRLVHDQRVRAPGWPRPTAWPSRRAGDHDATADLSADRRAGTALRARHRPHRTRADAHRARAGRPRPRAARRRRAAVVPRPRHRGRLDGAADPPGARCRGARSVASIRSRGRADLLRRAVGFAGFSLLAGWAGLGAGGWFRRADAVIAMSPPLTLGLTGRLVAWSHRAPLGVQHPGRVPGRRRRDRRHHRSPDHRRRVLAGTGDATDASDAVTVLSDDLRANVTAKLPPAARQRVRTIPNFVDTERDPAGRPHDGAPGGARHRGGAGGAVRRQRRVLAVAGTARRGRPPAARL